MIVLGLLALFVGRQVVAGQEGGRTVEPNAPAAATGTAFTYQGRLDDDLGPVTESCDMSFKLFDALTGGQMIGDPIYYAVDNPVPVQDGLFTVGLDFGAAFDGNERYLEIAVLCPGTGQAKPPLETLSPRQRLNPTPYASSAPWSGLSGMPAGFADGQDDANWLNRAAPPQGNTITTVDDSSTFAGETSITIGADGLPVISYYDSFDDDLKILHCENPACTSSSWAIVDATGDVGAYKAIAIGADGLPIISYRDSTNLKLKVAHCGNPACSAGNTITTLDSEGNVGGHTSITIGADGLPIISYFDGTNWNLKVAHCGDPACSAGNTITTLDSEGILGNYTSITIGADGLPIISYLDNTNGNLKVAHCGDPACSAGNTITTLDSEGRVGDYTSITIGADGLPIISYLDSTNLNLKVAHCGDPACSAGNTITTLDSEGWDGWHTSITIGADGLPIISYRYRDSTDSTNDNLKVAHCGDPACSAGNTITTLDSEGHVGWFTSITIGADGLPIISYLDVTNNTLKVAHCSNPFCTPYFRRR
jgi:hypothetical protein